MQCIIHDAPIDYSDEGTGQVLLFVHGWGDQKATWRPLIDVLKKNFRCIALDLPNFGASASNAAVTTIEDYAQVLAGFSSKLSITNYSYIGHSMGAQIGMYAVGRKRIQPERLVLIGAAGIRNDRAKRRKVLKVGAKIIGKLVSAKIKNKFYQAIGSDYNPSLNHTHKAIIDAVLSHDIQAEAAAITIPTLLIYGAEDTATPPRYGRLFAKLIPRSKYVELATHDHFVHQKAASIVASTIKEFIAESAV